MGTTFVSASDSDSGFWIHDSILELWLRLLSLHLPEPNDFGENPDTPEIRNRWLLASIGCFTGCVPHDMEYACATSVRRELVRAAIRSLLKALAAESSPLEPGTLNLLGIAGTFTEPLPREALIKVGHGFLDLIDGKVQGASTLVTW